MKKTKITPIMFLIVLSVLIFMFFGLPYLGEKSNVRLLVNKIQEEFKGVVVEKYSKRNTPPTHLRIKTITGKIEISPTQAVVKKLKIGDSIIKPKDENYVYLVSSNGERTKHFYRKLSYETRNSEYFPAGWKNKWMESSQWDN